MRVPHLEGKLAQMDPTTCLIFIDVKKAHFWSPARRRLLVELPSGMGYPPGKVGLLRKSLCGTRDAPANWEAAIKAVMMLIGFQQAKSNSCLYYHAEKQIRIEVRGDDFTGVGPKAELEWFAAELRKHWTIDVRGILGPPSMKNVDHSIVILNRLVTWTDKGIEMEADPRHVDLLLQEVGCEGSKVTTPLIKERIEEALTSEELDEETSAMYRSASMRLAYLSQDRPDLLVLGKELAKGLKRPTQAHFQMLKRGVRYLRSHPRMIHLFQNQKQFTSLEHSSTVRPLHNPDNLQVTSRDSIELRRGRILRTRVRTLPSTWRTVSAPGLGSACSHHRIHGCNDGTFNWKPSWFGKGQAHRYSISMGTRCRLGWKGKVVQEEHSRNARGPVYKTLGFRPDENALRQTQLPLLRRKTPFST